MMRIFKPFARILKLLVFSIYDTSRFIKYSGLKSDLTDIETRNYHIIKIYHALEKSLSYKRRRKNAGWGTASLLAQTLKAKKQGSSLKSFEEESAIHVLKGFLSLPENIENEEAILIKKQVDLSVSSNVAHGAKSYSLDEFEKGKLDRPEDFFHSRYTLREFKDKEVSEDEIKKAIWLSMKAPSACNRQPWKVYSSNDGSIIQEALKYQNGNRGFGHKIRNLLIITSDLKAFMPAEERYQHWIDGGLYAMSLIYAFHSIGVASCCLNWSASINNDLGLRRNLNIEPNHSIIMMLAIGYPDSENKVCVSSRKTVGNVLIELKTKVKN